MEAGAYRFDRKGFLMAASLNLKRSLASVLAAVLAIACTAVPAVQAHELDPSIYGPLVLVEAMYYDAGADEIRLDEGRIDYGRVTAAEVDKVRSGLAGLSDG